MAGLKALVLHMKLIHNVLWSKYQCKDCGQAFPKRALWKAHYVKTHPILLTFTCPLCSVVFGQEEEFKHHIKVCARPTEPEKEKEQSETQNVGQLEPKEERIEATLHEALGL